MIALNENNKNRGAEELPLLVKCHIGECVKAVYRVERMANNRAKLDLKGVVLERKLEGLEVDLKGEIEVKEEARRKPKAWAEVASFGSPIILK